MTSRNASRSFLRSTVAVLSLAALAATGCQGSYSGQTLPSPYYIFDDVQYFPAGPEFILSREAAELKRARDEMEQNRPQR